MRKSIMHLESNDIQSENVQIHEDTSEFLQIRYTDVFGKFLAKYVMIDKEQIHDLYRAGIGLDGSSVRGFANIEESDMMLVPDRSTATVAPFSNYKMKTVIADIHKGYNEGRLVRDPRYVAQLMEEYLAVNQVSCQIGAEIECFVFDNVEFNATLDKDNKNVKNIKQESNDIFISSIEQYGIGKYPIKKKGGYDAPPFEDSLIEFRFEIAEILKKYYSIQVTNLNHEVASSGQIEINFTHGSLTRMADNVQIYKDVVRNVAKKHDKIANFMPKPIFDEGDPKNGDNGSGMHVSISLWNKSVSPEKGNIFYETDTMDDYAELSQTGRYFIGGILDHASSLSAIVNPTGNSYYRLIPGFEAPIYVAWAKGNRSAIIRVPVNEKKNPKSKRIEFRAPDPSANPYLALSAVVSAGFDGIKKKIDPGNPVNENIYKMSDSKRRRLGIKTLPKNLNEALLSLKSDHLYLCKCFHKDLIEIYIALKKEELKQFNVNSKLQHFMFYHDV